MSRPKHATYQSIGSRPTTFHRDIDVILSLKDEMYKEFMFKFFIQLGSKNNNLSNQVEKDVAQEVIVKLKARSKIGGSTVRFFKPESRYSDKIFVEVDEISALESEFILCFPRSQFIDNNLLLPEILRLYTPLAVSLTLIVIVTKLITI